MRYLDLNINQKVNAKGNAGLLYSTFGVLKDRLPYGYLLLKRIVKKDGDMFNSTRLMK